MARIVKKAKTAVKSAKKTATKSAKRAGIVAKAASSAGMRAAVKAGAAAAMTAAANEVRKAVKKKKVATRSARYRRGRRGTLPPSCGTTMECSQMKLLPPGRL